MTEIVSKYLSSSTRAVISKANIFVVEYSQDEKRTFSDDPNVCHRHRREVEEAMNDYMTESGFTYGSERQKAIQAKFKEHMTGLLNEKPEILKTILPTYPPGCRRCEYPSLLCSFTR